jgi:hypothetical protein
MTYYEAALQILSVSRRPLTTREITDRAIQEGLVAPRGQTPHATMAAELYKRLGVDTRLIKTDVRVSSRAKWGSVRWELRRR